MEKTVQVTYQGIDLTIEGDYVPYRAATMYKSNGDPGDPEEGGYFEDLVVKVGDVEITDIIDAVKLTEIEGLAIVEACEGPDPDEGRD